MHSVAAVSIGLNDLKNIPIAVEISILAHAIPEMKLKLLPVYRSSLLLAVK